MQATARLACGLLWCLGLLTIAGAAPLRAQSSALQVGATVAPRCLITVDEATGDRSPAVTVSCGKTTLRTLRVSTSRGEILAPMFASRQLRAGGDLVFVLARSVGAVTSRAAMVPTLLDTPPSVVTVTLDF